MFSPGRTSEGSLPELVNGRVICVVGRVRPNPPATYGNYIMNILDIRDKVSLILESIADMTLYHVTAEANSQSILTNGVTPTSYWCNIDIANYYAETVEGDGEEPAFFFIQLSDLDPSLIEPDYEGIEEPITTYVGKSEEQVHQEWYSSSQTWQDSLRIIGSIRYRGVVSATLDDGNY